MLAMKGLTVYFPEENLPSRSLGRMAEYAVLQGLVFAAFMVLFTGLIEPDLRSTPLAAVRQFVIAALFVSPYSFFTAIRGRKKLSSTGS